MNNRGQTAQLSAIGWGLVTFGVIIGVGVVVLQKFGDQVVQCGTVGGGASTWNVTQQLCVNASGSTGAGSGSAYTGINYVVTQMGSSGLAGWIPLIVVVVVAGLIFAYFGMKGKTY